MNPELIDTIKTLRKASKEKSQPIRSDLSDELYKAKRRRNSVNKSSINIHTYEEAIVAVPGKVLSSGSLDHPVTVAAYSFSEGALEKIAGVNGKAMSLKELLDAQIDTSKIKIIK